MSHTFGKININVYFILLIVLIHRVFTWKIFRDLRTHLKHENKPSGGDKIPQIAEF